MNMERFFQLERQFQLVSRMIAAADGDMEAELIGHRSSITGEAREIMQHYDFPAPDWCNIP
jgi:hypothetical protein